MEEYQGTKKLIFETAVRLFAQRGVEETSMRDLSEEVGIKSSSIYNHFESKGQLLEAMYRYFDDYCHHHWPLLDVEDEPGGTDVPMSYPDKVESLIPRIINIAMSQSKSDPRAEALTQKYIFDCPRRQCRSMLRELGLEDKMSCGDIEAIAEIYTCICHSAAMRETTGVPVDDEMWRRMINTLFSVIRERA